MFVFLHTLLIISQFQQNRILRKEKRFEAYEQVAW